MYSDSPSQLKWVLSKSASYLLFQFSRITVILIAGGIPRTTWYHIRFTVVKLHMDFIFGEFYNLGKSSVCPTLLLVVSCEHHLCANLQMKIKLNRKFLVFELACNCTFIHKLFGIYLRKSLLVYSISSIISRCKRNDHAIFRLWTFHALVEVHDVFWSHFVHAYILQYVLELLVVILTIHFLELYLHKAHSLNCVCFVEEEFICLIHVVKQVFFCTLTDNRWQLEHVANEDELLAAERQSSMQSLTKGIVNSINDVTPDH